MPSGMVQTKTTFPCTPYNLHLCRKTQNRFHQSTILTLYSCIALPHLLAKILHKQPKSKQKPQTSLLPKRCKDVRRTDATRQVSTDRRDPLPTRPSSPTKPARQTLLGLNAKATMPSPQGANNQEGHLKAASAV